MAQPAAERVAAHPVQVTPLARAVRRSTGRAAAGGCVRQIAPLAHALAGLVASEGVPPRARAVAASPMRAATLATVDGVAGAVVPGQLGVAQIATRTAAHTPAPLLRAPPPRAAATVTGPDPLRPEWAVEAQPMQDAVPALSPSATVGATAPKLLAMAHATLAAPVGPRVVAPRRLQGGGTKREPPRLPRAVPTAPVAA